MGILIYLLPYVYSACLLAGFYLINLYTDLLWYVISALLIILTLVWVLLVRFKNFSQDQVVIFLSPLFYLLSSFAFFLLADSAFLKGGVVVLTTIGLFVILRALYFYHWKSVKYQPLSLQIQIKYLNTVSLFFLVSFLYSLETFLNISLWLTALVVLLFLFGSIWQENFLNRIISREKIYGFIFVVVIVQLFIAMGFLPFLVLVKGFLFFILYFIFYELFQATVRGLWRKQEIFWLLCGGGVLFTIILATTKWF